jgi:hypothetical protein
MVDFQAGVQSFPLQVTNSRLPKVKILGLKSRFNQVVRVVYTALVLLSTMEFCPLRPVASHL